MANTIASQILDVSSARAVVYTTIISDTTAITALPIYSSSATATANNDTDTLKSTIESIYAVVSSANTNRASLSFAATAPVLALTLPVGTSPLKMDFLRGMSMGGLKAPAGTAGLTGDITLTATGLAAGDTITIVMEVRRN